MALICACFVVPQHTHEVWAIRRMHELFGRSVGGFFALTMLCGCWCAWKTPDRDISAIWLFWIWSALTLLPLTGLFCSECLLLLTRLEPVWTLPIRAAFPHSVFWHPGFWEWTGAAAIFAFVGAAVFLTSSRSVVLSAVTRHQKGSCSCSQLCSCFSLRFQNLNECFLRNVNSADAFHSLFAFLLLFE